MRLPIKKSPETNLEAGDMVSRVRVLSRLALFLVLLGTACLSNGCARHRQWLPGPPDTADTSQIPNIWPVTHPAMRVTSSFGEVRSNGQVHQGLDIAVPKGTPVVATASGVASFSGTQRGYGKIITINHGNGFETAYAHLDALGASQGARLHQGVPIGRVGSTGNATGPHLHYEVRRKGCPVDPRPYLP